MHGLLAVVANCDVKDKKDENKKNNRWSSIPPSDYSSLSTYRVNQIEMIPAAGKRKQKKTRQLCVRVASSRTMGNGSDNLTIE